MKLARIEPLIFNIRRSNEVCIKACTDQSGLFGREEAPGTTPPLAMGVIEEPGHLPPKQRK